MGKDKNTSIMAVTDFMVLGGIALAATLILRNAGFAIFAGILGGLSIIFFILVLYLRLRTQHSIEAVKKEVKKEISEPLTLDYIKMRLEERNLNPQPIDGDEGYYFQSHGEWYVLRFSGTAIFLLHSIQVKKSDVDTNVLYEMAYSVDRSTLCSKVYVREDEEDSSVLYVDHLCYIFIDSRETFDRRFWEYHLPLARTSAVICENLNKM